MTLGQGPGTFAGVGFVAAGGVYRQRQNVDAVTSRGVEVDASLRFGVGRFNTEEEIAFAIDEVTRCVQRLRNLSPDHHLKFAMTDKMLASVGAGEHL